MAPTAIEIRLPTTWADVDAGIVWLLEDPLLVPTHMATNDPDAPARIILGFDTEVDITRGSHTLTDAWATRNFPSTFQIGAASRALIVPLFDLVVRHRAPISQALRRLLAADDRIIWAGVGLTRDLGPLKTLDSAIKTMWTAHDRDEDTGEPMDVDGEEDEVGPEYGLAPPPDRVVDIDRVVKPWNIPSNLEDLTFQLTSVPLRHIEAITTAATPDAPLPSDLLPTWEWDDGLATQPVTGIEDAALVPVHAHEPTSVSDKTADCIHCSAHATAPPHYALSEEAMLGLGSVASGTYPHLGIGWKCLSLSTSPWDRDPRHWSLGMLIYAGLDAVASRAIAVAVQADPIAYMMPRVPFRRYANGPSVLVQLRQIFAYVLHTRGGRKGKPGIPLDVAVRFIRTMHLIKGAGGHSAAILARGTEILLQSGILVVEPRDPAEETPINIVDEDTGRPLSPDSSVQVETPFASWRLVHVCPRRPLLDVPDPTPPATDADLVAQLALGLPRVPGLVRTPDLAVQYLVDHHVDLVFLPDTRAFPVARKWWADIDPELRHRVLTNPTTLVPTKPGKSGGSGDAKEPKRARYWIDADAGAPADDVLPTLDADQWVAHVAQFVREYAWLMRELEARVARRDRSPSPARRSPDRAPTPTPLRTPLLLDDAIWNGVTGDGASEMLTTAAAAADAPPTTLPTTMKFSVARLASIVATCSPWSKPPASKHAAHGGIERAIALAFCDPAALASVESTSTPLTPRPGKHYTRLVAHVPAVRPPSIPRITDAHPRLASAIVTVLDRMGTPAIAADTLLRKLLFVPVPAVMAAAPASLVERAALVVHAVRELQEAGQVDVRREHIGHGSRTYAEWVVVRVHPMLDAEKRVEGKDAVAPAVPDQDTVVVMRS
ncbi:hypothetical protein AMAG_06917 [Allomyces macrogynus ATCC 38327]|uniref:Uncharacterized protein n=1 Tax=Allomyces macrogynus (strain ATCC 38327) TaxID=578462 RepID=A0A0L0SF87_ALLM3|nr:hypothetical protein AMAG_06917 [Allomyces macrogynus ATCC 38327]|eukprot:KNE61166.1 hypothetical protein AMAG_06917 [Allomyces macrogynus ATCC 38327]